MLGLLVFVFAWIAGATLVLIIGLVDAGHGISAVQKAKGQLSASELVSQGPLGELLDARGDFSSAEGLLHSPLLTPFEVLPVIGRQLRSIQDLSSAAAGTTRIGIESIDSVRSVLDAPHTGGPERVTTLRRLASLASSTEAQLSRIDAGPSDALFSPIAHKRAEFVNQLDEVKTRLTHAAAVANVTARVLQGPSAYLVLMANPAEMRAGSGMFLEAGVMSSDDGEVHMSDLVPTGALILSPGVPVTGDLEARWGWLHPGVDWRNLGLTPQFDVNASLAASMWQDATGQRVDGVLEVDVQALQQILTVTGPVTLSDGQVVSSSNVVGFLTHDQYEGLSESTVLGGPTPASQVRQDELGELAHDALNALENESLDLKSLATAMSDATGGRHLMLWSQDPGAESAWEQGGVAGTLTAQSLLVALMNGGGNKLDQYMTVKCAVGFSRHGRVTSATLTVVLQNQTPPGQSQVIAGPYPGLGTTYGEYTGFLAVNLPSSASHIELQGADGLVADGPEGPTWLVVASVDVKQTSSERLTVGFDLPSSGTLTILPSARINPVPWTYPGGSSTDASAFPVSW